MWISAQFVILFSVAMCSGLLTRYNMELEYTKSLEVDGETIIDFSDLRIMGRNRYMNGTLDVKEDLNSENFKVSVDLQNDPLRNGEWRNTLLSMPLINICQAARLYFGPYLRTTLRHGETTNIPFDGRQCPLPKGNYYVKNLIVNTDTWPEIVPIGNVRGNVRFFKNGKAVGGICVQAEITVMNIPIKLA